jgi:hypothetical protein
MYLLAVALAALSLSWFTAQASHQLRKRSFEPPQLWSVAFAYHGDELGWETVKEQETIRRSFRLDPATPRKTLDLDNVFGSIEVASTSSNELQLVASRTIRAESKERLEAARKEVTLDMSQNGNDIRVFVNGPFRCKCCNDCISFHGDEGYVVKLDFQLQVPRGTELKLKTVNEGNVKVQGTSGNYSVRNVNGAIEMLDIAGSGSVRTVNGTVKVSFRENPRANSEFASVNGSVDLYFARNLSADFRFKTLNGGIYTDFVLTALPSRHPVAEQRNGRAVFRTDNSTGGRIGAGGPEIKVENLNGDIRVLDRNA